MPEATILVIMHPPYIIHININFLTKYEMSTFASLRQIGPIPIVSAFADGPLCSIGKSVSGCARIVGERSVVGSVVR